MGCILCWQALATTLFAIAMTVIGNILLARADRTAQFAVAKNRTFADYRTPPFPPRFRIKRFFHD